VLRPECILYVKGGVLLIRLEGGSLGDDCMVNLKEWNEPLRLIWRSLPPGLRVLTFLEEPLMGSLP
jgi:hypothetical protein